METVVIENQTHTLACLIRSHLFANDASFASCTVPHPLDKDLTVKLKHDDSCKDCLLASLRDARNDIEQCIRTVTNYDAHVSAHMLCVEANKFE